MNEMLIGRDSSNVKIVLSDKVSPAVKYAAQELQYWIEQITGIHLDVASEATAPFIALGTEMHGHLFGQLPDFDQEDYVIREKDGNLLIAGGEPRGTLYGVYTFLEEYGGCRWFTPECQQIPKISNIEVAAHLDRYDKPVFEYRDAFYTGAFDGDWRARNKANGAKGSSLKDHHGGAVRYTKGWFAHTFLKLVPPQIYAQDHPEYYALVNGVRQNEHPHAQLCLTNPEVLTISIEHALKALREDPHSQIISVSQSDGYGACECANCQAVVKEEGAQSGVILRYVNAVAAAIEQEFPQVLVDTLAYVYSRKPPGMTKPRHNVAVRLCSFECCFSHAFNDCRQLSNNKQASGTPAEMADFAGDVEAWSELTDRLYIWDYISNFELSTVPFPNLHVLAPNLGFLSQHGVKGVFSEGIYFAGNGGEMAELRSYLNTKLLWNPSFDVKTGTQQFLEAWFGPAAEPMRRYIDMMREETLAMNWHVGIYDSPKAPYLNADILDRADALFDEAESLVLNRPTQYARVLKERLSIRFPRFFQLMPAEERASQVEGFMRDAAAHKIDRFSEKWSKYEYVRRLLLEGVWPPSFSPKDYTVEVQ